MDPDVGPCECRTSKLSRGRSYVVLEIGAPMICSLAQGDLAGITVEGENKSRLGTWCGSLHISGRCGVKLKDKAR
jgi:hypothetical protein